VFSDGTPETYFDADTATTTCFARGQGHLMRGSLGNMGGTGNAGKVIFTISLLPGDMGDSGNLSTCEGSSATNGLAITSDEATASTPNAQGKLSYASSAKGSAAFFRRLVMDAVRD
jgi:hypothetical protein